MDWKQKIILFLKVYRGGLTLLGITFVVSLAAAALCSLAGASYVTMLFAGQSAGVLSLLAVGGLYRIASVQAPMCYEWGIAGIVLATIAGLMIF